MSKQILLILGMSIAVTSNTISNAIVANPNILKCPNNIRCKNLIFNKINDYLYLNIDILFNTLECAGSVTLNSKYTDSGTINALEAVVVSSLGKKYQTISIKINTNFASYLLKDNNVYLKHIGEKATTKLFTFKMKSTAQNQEEYTINVDNLESEGYIESTSSFPIIRANRIYYPKEIIDVRKCNLKKIIYSYYGRFPHEYLRFIYKTDREGTLSNKDFLSLDNSVYKFGMSVYIFGTKLFSRYTGVQSFGSTAKAFVFENYEYKNDMIYPKYSPTNIYVLNTGIMKRSNYITDPNTEKKLAKEITFPMDNFDYYYALAKNARCKISFSLGILSKFIINFDFNFNLLNDYFYNHNISYSLNGKLHENDLETNDIYYA